MSVEEGVFGLQDLVAADEAFLASMSRLAQPIASIADSLLPKAPGAQTLVAQNAIDEAMSAGAIA